MRRLLASHRRVLDLSETGWIKKYFDETSRPLLSRDHGWL